MNDQVAVQKQGERRAIAIRTYQADDQPAVVHLYNHGLLEGLLAPNDTGADIDNIVEAYFDEPRHHFWVAELDGRVVGTIAVGSDEEHTAEIRRLRVAPDCGHEPIADTLLDTALVHCRDHGYLKIRLDTRYERTAATDHFDRNGYTLTRARITSGKELLEFYLDLYREHRDEPEQAEA